MHIRLTGTPGEVDEALAVIQAALELVEASRPTANKGESKQVRVSVTVTVREPRLKRGEPGVAVVEVAVRGLTEEAAAVVLPLTRTRSVSGLTPLAWPEAPVVPVARRRRLGWLRRRGLDWLHRCL